MQFQQDKERHPASADHREKAGTEEGALTQQAQAGVGKVKALG